MPEERITSKSLSGNSNPPDSPVSIGEEIAGFIKQIDSLSTSLDLAIKVTTTVHEKISETLASFFEKYAKLISETDSHASYAIEWQHTYKYENLRRQREHAELTLSLLPGSFVVSLVNQFDGYLARLIRALYYAKPELLSGADSSLSFTQLIDFGSIDEAKEYVLDREIERLLHKSYAEQFAWLENAFGVPFRKEFSQIWRDFIEVTERRNHIVHRNGLVSSHYFTVCKEHDIPIDKTVKVGDALPVSHDYFDAAYACIYEIGVKLAHRIWRKLKPEELEKADNSLIATTRNLIVMNRYDLAIALLDFATLTLDKHFSDETRRTLVLSRALAYKTNKQENICSLILAKDDWTASRDEFQLAVAVLSDNFNLAIKLMEKIGPSELQDLSYREWPLFKELRKTFEFHRTYEKIFNKPFGRVELVSKTPHKTH
jgi:hypothetical protein